ncbi:MAG: carbohydrate isomerase [Clostridiales bacterium GWF2_38_85]|nr:MAG: carbohydrate isomerase [Clostridiales bacterium GWF2_38_85]HBL84244.1 carbohydrate isomerase [Clostridiales bacterium]
MLKDFLEISKDEFLTFIDTLDAKTFEKPVRIIEEAQKKGNRLHVTGIGKPSHVASYAASLFSSTGTPAYFLHGTEAVHGSSGQLVAGDVVICISNSGVTAEMKATATAVHNNGCKVIAITGNPDSWLAKYADAYIFAGVNHEGGPLNRAPRASIIAEILVLQALSVILQEKHELTAKEYIKKHPGGVLGIIRDGEK